MVKVGIRKLGKPHKKIELQQAVIGALEAEAAKIKTEYEKTTRTWKRRPTFVIRKKNSPLAREVGTDSKIYQYVDEGTEAHIIRAKNAKTLAFPTKPKFSPKTAKGVIGSKKGRQPTSAFQFPVSVQHPGTEGRDFTKIIQSRSKSRFAKAVQQAIAKAVKKSAKK